MVNLKGKVKFRGGKLNRAVLNKDSVGGGGGGYGWIKIPNKWIPYCCA